jgi:hypothetical protein
MKMAPWYLLNYVEELEADDISIAELGASPAELGNCELFHKEQGPMGQLGHQGSPEMILEVA